MWIFAFRLLGSHFEKYFAKDKRSHDLFVNRSASHTDVLVLLDWNTTQETLAQPYSHINLLKDIFEKWDPGIKHKKIKILNGGYQEWLERYPAFTTNPNIEIPEFKNVELDKIFETLEYPDWVYSDSEDEILKEERRMKNKLNKKSNSNKDIDVEMDHGDNKLTTSRHARLNDTVSSAKSKNFVTHVTISIDDKRPSQGDSANEQRLESAESPASAPQLKISSSKVPQNEVSAKPVIDRSSKPTVLKTYDPRCKEVLRFMKELNELARSKSKLANELLCQEYELYSQREDKYSASDEKYLRAEIKSLKVKLEDMVFIYLFFNLIQDRYTTCKSYKY